jgi:hypothetical protein
LKVGGKDIRLVGNQALEIASVTLNCDIHHVGGNILRWAYKPDPGPDCLRLGLEPDSETGGFALTLPTSDAWLSGYKCLLLPVQDRECLIYSKSVIDDWIYVLRRHPKRCQS